MDTTPVLSPQHSCYGPEVAYGLFGINTSKKKRRRIFWLRATTLTLLVVLTSITGYMSKASYPAQPVSWWFATFLAGLLGITWYLTTYAGKKPVRKHRHHR